MSHTETRVAQLGIVVENPDSVEKLNAILHKYGEYVIGRMGIPYHKRGINIISVVLDAPADVVSTLSGRIGMLDGVSTSAVYSKING
ncbi:MAG: iron-only hydrogenase system regulator [Clostridia bacterium]|nr:iron-only hydrogenase system regulator [Clostridia bacterium]